MSDDLELLEEIGEGLQKKDEPAAESKLRPAEVSADDVIQELDENMRERINTLIARGVIKQLTLEELDNIVIPEPQEDDYVPLAKYQFRRVRDSFNYQTLKADCLRNGITKYLVAKREVDDYGYVSYYILDGHTRYKIFRELLAEDPDFPLPTFLILDCSEADATLIAKNYNNYSENLDEEDDHFAIIRSIEIGGISQAEAARRFDKAESTISDIVAAFQKVPQDVRTLIESRRLKVKHGTQLARLRDYPKKQTSLANKAIDKYWAASQLKAEVDKELLRIGYLDDAAKVIDEVAGKYSTEGLEVRQKTKSEVEKIHTDLQKRFGKPESSWSSKMIFKGCSGGISIGPTKGQTERVLKKAGYKIVDDPPRSKSVDGQQGDGPMIALMPSQEELMSSNVCRFCGGSIDPDVAEKLKFDLAFRQAHVHCDIIDDIQREQSTIDRAKKNLAEFQKKLKNEKISTILEKRGITLEQFNEEAAKVRADVLREKQIAWYEENINLDKVKEATPDLVPEHYWEPIEKFLRQDEGYETPKDAASQVGKKGVARQSFNNQLNKVRQALASVE